MIVINFRNDNRDVFNKTIGRVVGNDGKSFLGVFAFKVKDRLFFHFDSGKDQAAFADDAIDFTGIFDYDPGYFAGIGSRICQRPATASVYFFPAELGEAPR